MIADPTFCAAPGLAHYTDPEQLPDGILGALVYGRDARARCAALGDPRLAGVSLDAAPGSARVEAWHTQGTIRSEVRDGIRLRYSDDHLFAVMELNESAHGGPRGAARAAYERLVDFHREGRYRHPWRIWNFIDAINEGQGDEERYRQFCLGRAEGLHAAPGWHPAASALGRTDGERTLQVIWLAGRVPGRQVENPRQVSAYRYPRQYGPASPSFSRAMRIGGQLYISGTSSIVGHETVHAGDITAQLNETLDNLRSVTLAAGITHGRPSGIKAYVRHAHDCAAVAAGIRARYPDEAGPCIVLADICRSDLLVELEAVSRA